MKLVGDIIKAEVSNISTSIPEDGPKSALEKELARLQYMGVYIVDKLHYTFINYKNWRDIKLQQATSLTRACRTTKPCENQKLNSVMSRGGLSFIEPKFQNILVNTEQYFCWKIEVSHIRETDVKEITYGLDNFKYIKEYFAEIVEESGLKPYGIVSDNVLQCTIDLYIKVRSSPTARDVQRHHCLRESTKKNGIKD